MGRPSGDSLPGMGEHLIAYDYGTGGLWAVVIAQSALAIRDK